LEISKKEPNTIFKPINAYMYKQFVEITLLWGAISTGFILLLSFIGFVSKDEADSNFSQFLQENVALLITGYLVLSLLILVIGFVIVIVYTKTMEFQIWGHEVVVKKGVINKTEKHVPYRTVTNISTRYGVFDRLFGIGTVEIETAGKSGQSTGPEEKIEGIRNFVEIRDIVLNEIRKYRTQYTTATEVEKPPAPGQFDVSEAILNELREIKDLLAKK